MAQKQIHILYTVLDWGLGHATRSIPIIQYLIDKNVKVTLVGEGDSLYLLRQNFPDCNYNTVQGLQVNYPSKGSLVLKMIYSIPKNLLAIYNEHQQIKKLVNNIKPDAIISDNRFGAWSNDLPCIFITHQIKIQAPKKIKFIESLIFKMNKFFIKRFSKVWIPDFEDETNLTGELSHDKNLLNKINFQFIGPVSRFIPSNVSTRKEGYELLIILSGPEPQRSIFEKLCIEQSIKLDLKTLLVRGKPQEKIKSVEKNLTIVSNLSIKELQSEIENSKAIVCRSGHSTIMDLYFLNKSALCVATPGQTEQEYLSEYLSKRNNIVSQEQSNFNLKEGLKKLSNITPFRKIDYELMQNAVDEFLNALKN